MPPSQQPTVTGEGEPALSHARPLRRGARGDCSWSDPRALALHLCSLTAVPRQMPESGLGPRHEGTRSLAFPVNRGPPLMGP